MLPENNMLSQPCTFDQPVRDRGLDLWVSQLSLPKDLHWEAAGVGGAVFTSYHGIEESAETGNQAMPASSFPLQ